MSDGIVEHWAEKKRKKSNLEILADEVKHPEKVREFRKDALRDIIKHDSKKILVDTCWTPDCGWETAIERTGGDMVIVEEYPDKEAAGIGHDKWLKAVKENPDMDLPSCRTPEEWFFGVKPKKKKLELVDEIT